MCVFAYLFSCFCCCCFCCVKIQPLVTKPLLLIADEAYEKQLAFKKSLRTCMKESFYYIDTNRSESKDYNAAIERYSDRFIKLKKADINSWQTGAHLLFICATMCFLCNVLLLLLSADWNRLPKELRHFYEKDEKAAKKRKTSAPPRAPNLVKRKVKTKLDLSKIMLGGDEENEENEDNEDNEGAAANGTAADKEKKSDKGSDDEDENQQDEENMDDDDGEDVTEILLVFRFQIFCALLHIFYLYSRLQRKTTTLTLISTMAKTMATTMEAAATTKDLSISCLRFSSVFCCFSINIMLFFTFSNK